MSWVHPYRTAPYAAALGHVGQPFEVPEWGTWVLVRTLPRGRADATGTYPLAILDGAVDLAGGLERLRRAGLVSVVAVTCALHGPPADELRRMFEVVRPFKTHWVAIPGSTYSAHHRRDVARARRLVEARRVALEGEVLAQWCALYDGLVRRRGLGGVHAFGHAAHEAFGALQGMVAYGAFLDDELVACHVFATDGRIAHSHLAASSEAGYRVGAAYAVLDAALADLADHEAVCLGGSAGTADDPSDGLARFKRGFAASATTSWVLGAVLDDDAYRALAACRAADDRGASAWFPAYRAPQELLGEACARGPS